MLRSLKDLEGYGVSATDGDLGKVENFLLDDESWTIRYLVVDTGGFFTVRSVLISPLAFRSIEWAPRFFHLALTKDKIMHSPGTDTDLPVSRQHERDHFLYYGYPNYWGASGVWNLDSVSMTMLPPTFGRPEGEGSGTPDDSHLRSARVLSDYHIPGSDDEIGHVEDFIVDDETWAIRYLVVNTSNLWFGKKVLVSPFWATRVDWEHAMIHLGLSRQEIKDCPEWNADAAVNRSYEERLFAYSGRPVYWDRGGLPADHHDPAPAPHGR